MGTSVFSYKGATVDRGRPVVGPLGRSGYGGRNWEGFSPDPYLTGEAVNATIIAMQSTGNIVLFLRSGIADKL